MSGGEADARQMMETRSVEVPCAASNASYSWSGFGASRLQHFTVGSGEVRDGDD